MIIELLSTAPDLWIYISGAAEFGWQIFGNCRQFFRRPFYRLISVDQIRINVIETGFFHVRKLVQHPEQNRARAGNLSIKKPLDKELPLFDQYEKEFTDESRLLH